jgi:hypothetical protein
VWGEVELEPEVEHWLRTLTDDEFGRAAFYFDLLGDRGSALGFPYTSQLDGKLRELRFWLGERRFRISYFIATGRRIVLLTAFEKTARREQAQIERARRAMATCIARRHTAEED